MKWKECAFCGAGGRPLPLPLALSSSDPPLPRPNLFSPPSLFVMPCSNWKAYEREDAGEWPAEAVPLVVPEALDLDFSLPARSLVMLAQAWGLGHPFFVIKEAGTSFVATVAVVFDGSRHVDVTTGDGNRTLCLRARAPVFVLFRSVVRMDLALGECVSMHITRTRLPSRSRSGNHAGANRTGWLQRLCVRAGAVEEGSQERRLVGRH